MCTTQVATREDPASARLGESVYRFVPRSIIGNWRDAMHIELVRLAGLQQTPLSLQNRCASVQLSALFAISLSYSSSVLEYVIALCLMTLRAD